MIPLVHDRAHGHWQGRMRADQDELFPARTSIMIMIRERRLTAVDIVQCWWTHIPIQSNGVIRVNRVISGRVGSTVNLGNIIYSRPPSAFRISALYRCVRLATAITRVIGV